MLKLYPSHMGCDGLDSPFANLNFVEGFVIAYGFWKTAFLGCASEVA